MSGEPYPEETLSRTVDHLNDIGGKLRDLQGYATLANELIQNADDAEPDGADWITFNISEENLVVDNNGSFATCGDPSTAACVEIERGGRSNLCDFHRFRKIASGDKRDQSGTTGAFGIGFISVYQITDYPELLSSGEHWKLREDRPSSENIIRCRGCPTCSREQLPGTRFILPWARNPDSSMRRGLRQPAVPEDVASTLRLRLEEIAPLALLFLKRVREIRVAENGRIVSQFSRAESRDGIEISGPQGCRKWRTAGGSFDEDANRMRKALGRAIEEKRSHEITVAVACDGPVKGQFFACLPTDHVSGLPFHINADFYPKSDRKSIVFGEDYQSEWNTAALRASGEAVLELLEELPALMGAVPFWGFIEVIWKCARGGEKSGDPRIEPDASLVEVWNAIRSRLPEIRCVSDSEGTWRCPSEIHFLGHDDIRESAPILASLGIPVLHPDLRRFRNVLTQEAIGVQQVTLATVADALRVAGLTSSWTPASQKTLLNSCGQLETLHRLIDNLLRGLRGERQREAAFSSLQELALAPTTKGRVSPCNAVYRSSRSDIEVFEDLSDSAEWLDHQNDCSLPFEKLCSELSIDTVVELLEDLDRNGVLATVSRQKAIAILEWLSLRKSSLDASDALKARLEILPLIPAGGELRAARDLVLPGGFEDPLSLAGVVDHDLPVNVHPVLHVLGVGKLSVQRYASEYLPRLLEGDPDLELRQRAVRFLTDKFGELRRDEAVQRALSDVLIVECVDGRFHLPGEAYLPTEEVRTLLGSPATLARLGKTEPKILEDLYRWLGVRTEVDPEAVVERVLEIVRNHPTQESVEWNERVISFIQEHLGYDGEAPPALETLRKTAWLPAESDGMRWHWPQELHAVTLRHLIGEQATYLGVSRAVQQRNMAALAFLGVRTDAETNLIIENLLASARSKKRVSREVYRYLSDRADEKVVLTLRGEPCIDVGPQDGSPRYVPPSHLFWGEHPFGILRHRLGSDLRAYSALFDTLEVRGSPTREDAISVLKECGGALPENGKVASDLRAAILGAWQFLARDLLDGSDEVSEIRELHNHRCIVTADDLLVTPKDVVLEDRGGIAAQFSAEVQTRILPREEGLWKAWVAAGVASLASRLEVDPLEPVSPRPSESLKAHLLRRSELLDRIASDVEDRVPSQEVLRRTEVIEVDELRAGWRLEVGRSSFCSPPKEVEAACTMEPNTLYVVADAPFSVSAAAAKEIAWLLWPNVEPSSLAAPVMLALRATDHEEGSRLLDDLGFPPLEMPQRELQPTETLEEVVSLGGHEEPLTGEADGAGGWADDLTGEGASGTDATSPSARRSRAGRQEPITSSSEASDAAAGDGDSTRHASDLKTKALESKPRSSKLKLRGRFRTYVSQGDGLGGESEGVQRARERIDEAGVSKVEEFEKQHGRRPNRMAHYHEGYDIECLGDDGRVERYIEVKSRSGLWDARGVHLSAKQYEYAQNLGERYWLYVVELADSSSVRVWRIQNPAGLVNEYFYDEGWKEVARAQEAVRNADRDLAPAPGHDGADAEGEAGDGTTSDSPD